MKKIVHITDLHIGVPGCTANTVAAVQRILTECSPAEHVVVITGDIVDDAGDDTLEGAWTKTLAPLSTAGFKVLAVPGNHDFGGGAEIYPKLARAFYDTVGPKPIPVVQVDVLDGLTFIGVDSQFERMHWIGWPPEDGAVHRKNPVDSDGLMGWIGKAQRQAIADAIADAGKRKDKVVVYLHHDPLYRLPAMELGNWHMLKSLVAEKVDVLLCGHSHKYISHCGEWGIPHFYNGGSTGGRKMAKPSPIRIIDPRADSSKDTAI